jgi:hypothetical protein
VTVGISGVGASVAVTVAIDRDASHLGCHCDFWCGCEGRGCRWVRVCDGAMGGCEMRMRCVGKAAARA